MKSVTKQIVTLVLAMVVAAPAFAAEINKGTKSYQKKDTAQTASATEIPADAKAGDVADIAPAAGATEQQEMKEGKSFKEELRLPRKN